VTAIPAETGLALSPSKTKLLNLVQELAQKNGWSSRGRVRSPAVLGLLGEGACERAIGYRLANPDYREPAKFDTYYAEKNEFATTFLLDNLKRRLDLAGYKAALATEVGGDAIGTYDVVVVQGRGVPCLVMKGSVPMVRIEIKGSLGLPMKQLGRYMLNEVPIVLCRVVIGTTILLRPRDHEEFVNFYADLLVAKAERLLAGGGYVVPGPGCRDCPDLGCPYREQSHSNGSCLVAMKGDDFSQDLARFYNNLPRVADKCASLVLQVLKEGNGVQN
jgi:hypothetical protein